MKIEIVIAALASCQALLVGQVGPCLAVRTLDVHVACQEGVL
jgi:hypothetical protein